jgi:hypothetical protein
MKKSIIILILITLNSCKPSPTYNAFDNEFNISIREVVKNGSDTITVGCGYFNYRQKKGRLRNYYQIYVDDWNNVVAKGFDYFLDTLNIKGEKNYEKIRSLKISNSQINELDSELRKYGYRFHDQKEGEFGTNFVRIINETSKEKIKLGTLIKWKNEKDSIIYRELGYFKGK